MKNNYSRSLANNLACGRQRVCALIVILTAILSLSLASAKEPSKDLTKLQRSAIEKLTDRFMQAGGYPSVTVLIDQAGNTLYANAMGLADIEQNIPASIDSAYAIGSITKPFTALATLQLVDSGKIILDKPVSEYLKDYQGPARDIPVRRLLDHTSGIPNYTNDIPGIYEQLSHNHFDRTQMVDFFDDLPLLFEPGEKFRYTNSGFYLLGLIIEEVSGISYYDYVQTNIFDPLGMSRSYSGDPTEIIPKRAHGYIANQQGYANAPRWAHTVPFSAGSLFSTAKDLAKYQRGVFSEKVFSQSLLKLVMQTNDLNDGTSNLYTQGGLVVSNFLGRKKYSHSGDVWGYSADYAYYPKEDLTIVILANRRVEAPSVVSLEQKIAREVFCVKQPVIRDLTLPQTELERLQGDYHLHPFIFGPSTYGFVGQNGKLFLRFGGSDAQGPLLPLLAQGDGRFVFAFDDEWWFQFAEDAGQASGFESFVRDGIFYARRGN